VDGLCGIRLSGDGLRAHPGTRVIAPTFRILDSRMYRSLRQDSERPMAWVTPRDVHVATVVGGAIIGVAFGRFGGLPLLSALASSDAHPYLCALVGATFFLAARRSFWFV
jgi:hypothetical protein